jgi:hypothetical protein
MVRFFPFYRREERGEIFGYGVAFGRQRRFGAKGLLMIKGRMIAGFGDIILSFTSGFLSLAG